MEEPVKTIPMATGKSLWTDAKSFLWTENMPIGNSQNILIFIQVCHLQVAIFSVNS
jgi:hypothetical protein